MLHLYAVFCLYPFKGNKGENADLIQVGEFLPIGLVGIVLCHPFPFFFFNDTATTEIYTLSLHDALPISFLFDLRQDGIRSVRSWWLRGPFGRRQQRNAPSRPLAAF